MKRLFSEIDQILPKEILQDPDISQMISKIQILENFQLPSKIKRLGVLFNTEQEVKSKFLRIFIKQQFIEEPDPYFLLTIEGHILDPKYLHLPFGYFFDRIRVQVGKKQNNPNVYYEWTSESVPVGSTVHCFQFKIQGDKSTPIRIFFFRNYDLKPRFDVSDKLRTLFPGLRIDPCEDELLLSVWQYATSRDLVDKKIIRCDEALTQALGCDTLAVSQMRLKLTEHLLAPKPIHLDYLLSPTLSLSTISPPPQAPVHPLSSTPAKTFSFPSFLRSGGRVLDVEVDILDESGLPLIRAINQLAHVERSDRPSYTSNPSSSSSSSSHPSSPNIHFTIPSALSRLSTLIPMLPAFPAFSPFQSQLRCAFFARELQRKMKYFHQTRSLLEPLLNPDTQSTTKPLLLTFIPPSTSSLVKSEDKKIEDSFSSTPTSTSSSSTTPPFFLYLPHVTSPNPLTSQTPSSAPDLWAQLKLRGAFERERVFLPTHPHPPPPLPSLSPSHPHPLTHPHHPSTSTSHHLQQQHHHHLTQQYQNLISLTQQIQVREREREREKSKFLLRPLPSLPSAIHTLKGYFDIGNDEHFVSPTSSTSLDPPPPSSSSSSSLTPQPWVSLAINQILTPPVTHTS